MTDFDFSPFHDDLLATGAEDCCVKLWNIPEGGVNGTLTTPTSSLTQLEARVEGLVFHPTADNVSLQQKSALYKIVVSFMLLSSLPPPFLPLLPPSPPFSLFSRFSGYHVVPVLKYGTSNTQQRSMVSKEIM